jgi:pyrimidine oxygenase
MGIWRDLDHAQLYDVATEWITVAKRLWSEDRVDFEGTYYHLVDCMSYPKPIQRPHPPIMCAATSEGGLRFTIQHADASLVNGQDIPDLERNGLRSKALAAELGTTTRTIGLVMVVPGETDADAEARVRHYNEGADLEALSARAMEWSASAKEWSRDEELRRQRTRMFPDGRTPAAMSRNTVTGTPEHLAEKIADVIERGDFDWLAFYFPDYLADLEIFGREVLPVLVKEGIGRKDTPKPSLGSPVET